ncbi:MAG: hypothetical protein U1E56_02240 [Bauldia sp.]
MTASERGDEPTIRWPPQWRAVADAREREGLEAELQRELAPPHWLYGRTATVIGRSLASDDIVIALDDGGYAVVHLTWAGRETLAPETFPAATPCTDSAALQAAMADPSGEED